MALPTQFRIFRKGINTSTKGTVVFDDAAAKAVMADYANHGADLMMDLEHLSVAKDSPNYNPNAMAWFKLAVRNGELWATDVRYTPEGAKRLTDKSQRYISPLFMVDKATKRVVQVINSALTALPASDKPMALVAASQNTAVMAFSIVGNPMDLSALIQLLGLPADATLDDIVAAVKALQEGKAPAASEAAPAAPQANTEGAGMGGAASPPVAETPVPAAGPRKTTVSIQHNQDAGSAAVIELSRKVATLEAAALNRSRDDLIRANADKLTPVLEQWARTQSIETLTTFFAAAAPASTTEQEPARETVAHSQSPKGSAAVVLTAADIEACKLTGVSQEAALAYKQSQANAQ